MTALIILALAGGGLCCTALGVLLATATRQPCPPATPETAPDPDDWWR